MSLHVNGMCFVQTGEVCQIQRKPTAEDRTRVNWCVSLPKYHIPTEMWPIAEKIIRGELFDQLPLYVNYEGLKHLAAIALKGEVFHVDRHVG